MSGSFYLIAKIVVFLLTAAVIGYVIGRLTSRKAAEPLKRLADVDSVTSRAPSPSESASQAAELRRRLGVAYQTIRELEEKNVLLQEASATAMGAAVAVAAPETSDETPAEEAEPTPVDQPDPVGSVVADGGESSEELPAPAGDDDPAAGSGDEPADAQDRTAEGAMGPAERIRAAKQARDTQASAGAAPVEEEADNQA